jgi:hypothetical protein
MNLLLHIQFFMRIIIISLVHVFYKLHSRPYYRLYKYITVIIIKPVTNEQVFYDKLSYWKFYFPIARVYVQQIFYDKFLVFDSHDSYY